MQSGIPLFLVHLAKFENLKTDWHRFPGKLQNKLKQEVLLCERKRHTARRVASTSSVILVGRYAIPGQGVPHPWPGYPLCGPGQVTPHLDLAGVPLHVDMAGVHPPVWTWLGYPPPRPDQGTPIWTWLGYTTCLDLDGVPTWSGPDQRTPIWTWLGYTPLPLANIVPITGGTRPA